MKKIVSLFLVVVMLCGSMVVLSSCGEPKDAGAEISVYLGAEIYDFDPTDYYADSNADQVMSLLYEPLFKINSKGKLECAAADEYTVDEDERQIVISLRESYWSDEIRVKADDYIYAWREVLLNPANPNPAAVLLYDIENAAAIKLGQASYAEFGAVKSEIYEITITYREGADYEQLLRNLASVATAPLRQDIVSASKTYWTKDMSTIVTNGPFKIEALDYEVGDFALGRNLGYHQPSSAKKYTKHVSPATLVSFFVNGEKTAVTYSDIENKTVFYMGDTSLEDRAANKDKATAVDDMSTYSYVFNTENPLFAKAEVRRALSLALDRAMIAEAVTFGKAATGFLPDNVAKSVYGKNIDARISADHEANLAEAKALIAAADFTGISKSFTLTVNNDEESLAIAQLAKAAWSELGFNVTVKKVGTVTSKVVDTTLNAEITIKDSAIQALIKEASYGKRNFDVIAVDWQMYSDDAFVALSAFTSTMNGCGTDFTTGAARKNISGWTSADYDHYMNAAYMAENEEDRAAALKEAEKILLDSAPVAPIIYNQSFAFVSRDLSKLKTDGFGNFVFTDVKQKNYRDYLEKEDN